MKRRFFNAETGIWRVFGWTGDIVVLSLMWTICSIPLITLGAASTALYDTMVHNMRRHESGTFSRFFGTFRKELKTACPTTLLWGAVGGILICVYRRLVTQGGGQTAASVNIGFVILFLMLLGVLSWVFPLLSRFTFGFWNLNRTALQLSAGKVLRTAAMSVLMAGSILLVIFWNYLSILFVPGLAAWLSGCLIEPVFAEYENKGDAL